MVGDRYIQYKCARCGVPMKLVQGKYSMYYRCPKYEFQHRTSDEQVCTNKLSLYTAEQIEKRLQEAVTTTGTVAGMEFTISRDKDVYKVTVQGDDEELIFVATDYVKRR